MFRTGQQTGSSTVPLLRVRIKTLPGGFTVFMFSPLKHRKPTDKKDRIGNIRGTFGKEGSLDDEAIDFYATLDYFLPTSLSNAQTQLEMAVHLLEALTHRQGIAIIDPRRNDERMLQRDKRDKELMGKYVPSLLDDVFNELVEGPEDDFEPPSWLLQAV
jgi:hypothetical protein